MMKNISVIVSVMLMMWWVGRMIGVLFMCVDSLRNVIIELVKVSVLMVILSDILIRFCGWMLLGVLMLKVFGV